MDAFLDAGFLPQTSHQVSDVGRLQRLTLQRAEEMLTAIESEFFTAMEIGVQNGPTSEN